MKVPRVFVSMGTPYTEDQMRFRETLESLLRTQCGVDPRIIGVNEYPPGSPVHKIRDVMSTCDGVIVVAYERKYVQRGVERRGSARERALVDEKYTTTWNHVESAVAFSMDIPLYILCETGLVEEGLIESKVDWFVQRIDLTSDVLSKPQVLESIRAWINERVMPHAKKSTMGILPALARLKFSELTSHDLYVLYALLGSVFAIGTAVGAFLPQLMSH
jgi:hypothetical protein